MKTGPTQHVPPVQDLDRVDAVLLGLLAAMGEEVLRTKMVKLTYLLDDLSFRHDDVTITGFDYHWDHHGPNAVGNEIVKRLDAMSQRGLALTREILVPSGYRARGYQIADRVEIANLPLTVDDWALIHSVVYTYGRMSRADIIRASKQTIPMQNAKQYQRIEFRRDPDIDALKRSFLDDPGFLEMIMTAADSERITFEELREVVAKSTDL